MSNVDPKKVLNDNISALQQIKNELSNIQNVKLNSLDFNLRQHDYFKKQTSPLKPINSNLSIKIKKKNIHIVNFGLSINIGCDVLYDYLYNKQIQSINLSFKLKNLCEEENILYFMSASKNKSLLCTFSTSDKDSHHINLDENISFLEQLIDGNSNLSFFLPIFKSYDNYDDFYDAISEVTFCIHYCE